MKALLALAILGFAFAAQAAEPFTPYVGITIPLLDEKTCVSYDGDAFDPVPEIDYISQECTGFGAWRVLPYGGDARTYLKLVNGKSVVDFAPEMQAIGQFPNIGNQLEFRVHRVRRKGAAPVAALVAATGQDPENYEKSHVKILIAKLSSTTKNCVIASVPAKSLDDKEAWDKARALADSAAAKHVCK